MKTILVPLDGSALAERALPYVQLLAPALGTHVRLLHAFRTAHLAQPIGKQADQPPVGDYAAGDWRSWPAWELPGDGVENYLAAQATKLRAGGLRVEVASRPGRPATAIVEAAAQADTLIAMATHGYQGLKRWSLGSVADEVLHTTHAPLLLVRGGQAPRDIRRILLPLDGSGFARQALPAALDLAIGTGAELIVLQSVAGSVEEYIAAAPQISALRTALGREVTQAYTLRGGLAQSAVVTPTVVVGAAADAIVEETERRRVDLIVMATHGYQGLKRWRAGSVAEDVLHMTSVPVLLVRGDEVQQ
jgi:nucleotide-binding universal stress UspA family protein